MVYRRGGGWGEKNGEEGKQREVMFWETSSFTLRENEHGKRPSREKIWKKNEWKKIKIYKKEGQLILLNALQTLSLKVSGVSDHSKSSAGAVEGQNQIIGFFKWKENWGLECIIGKPLLRKVWLDWLVSLTFQVILFFDKYLLSAIQCQERQDTYILGLAGQ